MYSPRNRSWTAAPFFSPSWPGDNSPGPCRLPHSSPSSAPRACLSDQLDSPQPQGKNLITHYSYRTLGNRLKRLAESARKAAVSIIGATTCLKTNIKALQLGQPPSARRPADQWERSTQLARGAYTATGTRGDLTLVASACKGKTSRTERGPDSLTEASSSSGRGQQQPPAGRRTARPATPPSHLRRYSPVSAGG